jgi:hypothetical protein
MNAIATSLLKSLLGPQSASGASGPGVSVGGGGGGLNFANLLSAARSGQVTSDRPVEVAPEVNGQLTAEQLSRIAVAADHAESTGMSNALVLIDGKAVTLDVDSREVTAVMDPRTAAITDIDGVLAAPPSSLSAQVAGGSAAGEPGSIAGVLEQQLLAKLGNSSGIAFTQASALSSALRR